MSINGLNMHLGVEESYHSPNSKVSTQRQTLEELSTLLEIQGSHLKKMITANPNEARKLAEALDKPPNVKLALDTSRTIDHLSTTKSKFTVEILTQAQEKLEANILKHVEIPRGLTAAIVSGDNGVAEKQCRQYLTKLKGILDKGFNTQTKKILAQAQKDVDKAVQTQDWGQLLKDWAQTFSNYQSGKKLVFYEAIQAQILQTHASVVVLTPSEGRIATGAPEKVQAKAGETRRQATVLSKCMEKLRREQPHSHPRVELYLRSLGRKSESQPLVMPIITTYANSESPTAFDDMVRDLGQLGVRIDTDSTLSARLKKMLGLLTWS